MPRILDFGSAFVKNFTKSMYPHHEFHSEFSRDIDAHVSEDLARATSTVERRRAGIQRFYSVVSFIKKQPIMFSSDHFRNQRFTRSMASLNSSNEGIASDATTSEAASSKSKSLSGLAGNLKGGSNLAKDIGIESRIFSELVSDPDFLNIFKPKTPISPLDDARNQEDVLEPAENADFLSSVNATLLYDRAKYAASGLSYVNFATVIYRNRGFTVPAPPSDKDQGLPAGDESFPVLPMAHREHCEEYVQSRESSVLDSSNTTSTRARVFSFLFNDNDAYLDSATDPSDDEWSNISVKMSSPGIFKKGFVICTTCRQRISMPDLPVLPAAAPVRPAAGHRILQPNVVKVDLTDKVSEEDKLDNLLANIRQLILEQPLIDSFDSSSETAASIGEAVAHNRLPENEFMGIDDNGEEERPLRIPLRNLYTSNSILAIDKTESRAEECRRHLYMCEEWVATETLYYQIADQNTFAKAAQEYLPFLGEILEILASEAEIVQMWKFAQFASTIKEVSETGDSNDYEEVDTLLDVVHGYRKIFCYLINNIVLPVNAKFERLLREFLYMRSTEGELILEAARIGRELARLQKCEMESGPSIKQKLSDLSSSLQKVEGRSKRYQREFSHIEKGLSGRILTILESSSLIGSVRVSVLNMWALFHDISDLDLICSHNIHDVTRKEEFEKITFWHSNATVSELHELLAEDLQILAECHALFQTIIALLQESIDYMREGLAMQTHS